MGQRCLQFLVVMLLIFGFVNIASAEEAEVFDTQMIEFTKEAAEAQLSLSDKGYSYEEVKEKLLPYFTESFVNQFITINMMKDSDGLYYVMGTDFPIYYIPFYLYEEETWVMTDTELGEVAVYEYFPASTDGPVGYDNHYEAVIYTWENNQWKVKEINPQFNPNQFEAVAKENVSTVDAVEKSEQDNHQTAEVEDGEPVIVEKAQSLIQMFVSFFTRFLNGIFK